MFQYGPNGFFEELTLPQDDTFESCTARQNNVADSVVETAGKEYPR